MNFQSIDEIFAENDRIHAGLLRTLESISDTQASKLADGEKWTISQIVEHIAIVDEGSSKICNRLLTKAREENRPAAGSVNISNGFRTQSAEIDQIKIVAPDRVQPSGNIPIADSLVRMEENRRRLGEIKPLFENFDGDSDKFPHPFLGDLSAVEWLIMKGGHEARHTRQIERILQKLA